MFFIRKEPTITFTPDELVADAIAVFEKAVVKLDAAKASIEKQEQEILDQMAELSIQADNALKAKGRLTRIREKLDNLLN